MVIIEKDLCIGCGKCVKDCVAHNIILKDGKAEPKRDCFLCGHCVAVCPRAAVSIPEYDMAEVEEYEKESFTMNPDTLLHAVKYRRSIRDYQNRKSSRKKSTLCSRQAVTPPQPKTTRAAISSWCSRSLAP